MRTLMRVAMSCLLVSALGCGGDNTGPNGQTNGDMTAKIDGSSWSSVATFATRNATNGGTIVALSGADANSTAIGMAFVDTGVGTYTITGTSVTNADLIESGGHSWTAGSLGGSGTLTVTTLDATHVVGTFAFTMAPTSGTGASGTRSVTQGTFDVRFGSARP
jgi:hypothetical protein